MRISESEFRKTALYLSYSLFPVRDTQMIPVVRVILSALLPVQAGDLVY